MFSLLIFHAIFGLERIKVNFIASIIWHSTLLTSGSLQHNVIDAAINKWRKRLACICADGQHFEHFFMSFS